MYIKVTNIIKYYNSVHFYQRQEKIEKAASGRNFGKFACALGYNCVINMYIRHKALLSYKYVREFVGTYSCRSIYFLELLDDDDISCLARK